MSKQFGSCDNGIYMYIIAKRLCVCLQLVIIHGTPRALAIHGTVIHQHVTNHIHIIAVSWIIPLITHTLKKLYSRCYKTPLRDHRAESNRHLVSLLVSVLRWRLCPLVCGPPSALSEKKSKQDRLPMPFLYPPSTWHLLPSSPSSPLLSSGLDTHHASDFIGSMVRAPVASQRWLITGIRCFR